MSTELDIQQFIDQANQDVPSDTRVITPEGDFPMYVKPGSTKMYEGVSEKNGKAWRLYTSTVIVDDPAVREATNLPEPTARVAFMLDLTDSGSLAVGTNRNTKLGQLLEATGNRKSGWTYAMIEGVPFKGKVIHKADKKDANRINAEVVAFAKS